MRSDVIIIGEAPGPRDSGKTPLFGMSNKHAGWKLREMANLSREEWLRVRRVNLFSVLPEKWNGRDAETTAFAWAHALLREHRVILLGKRVARAFLIHDKPSHAWTIGHTVHALHDIHLAWVPHPSGRNLAYNDPEMRKRTGQFLRRALIPRGQRSSSREPT